MITALTVNYNTPDLLEKLIVSFRQFYDIPYTVVDGSSEINFEKIKYFPEKYEIELCHFNYNIHHGPGLAWGMQHIQTEQILFLDSDITILNNSTIENYKSKLKPESYGIGGICFVNDNGVNVINGIKYLHPACALINRKIALKYPLPIKHGAPMLTTMKYLYYHNLDILQHEPNIVKGIIAHEISGTISRTGGIHL
ncbi:MAG: glycosyltransferase family 2 protein [Bacteroidales bacterium]|nr:glycosyltransferase family 2 protein [Bacteroidales bacterium]